MVVEDIDSFIQKKLKLNKLLTKKLLNKHLQLKMLRKYLPMMKLLLKEHIALKMMKTRRVSSVSNSNLYCKAEN